MNYAATGHRPEKLGYYGAEAEDRLMSVAALYLKDVIKPHDVVISGMALGWDQAVAQACYNLDIPFIAAVPCRNQAERWTSWYKSKYESLLLRACHVVYVSEAYDGECMQRRNQWMVDHADKIIACWDGSRGGTYNCIQYAKKKHKRIDNLYQTWVAYNNVDLLGADDES